MAISQLYPNQRPTINLNFARSKALDPRISFTRNSTATYVGSDGLIKTAAAGEARFDHDPVTGDCRGLLIEESRTNLALESEDWGNTTYWYSNGNKGGLNTASAKDYFIATNNTTDTLSPDGANNAVKLTGDTNYTSSGFDFGRVNIVAASITLSQNTEYTFSVFIKDPNSVFDSNQLLYIQFGYYLSSANAYAAFDFQNNTVTYGGDYSSSTPGSIESYPNGWKKLTATFANTSFGGGVWLFINETNNFYGPNTFSTNGESFYAFGFQIEEGAFPTSYIPTSGATVTRVAENAQLNGVNVTSWYNIPEGTVYSEGMSPLDLTTSRYVWAFSNPGRKEHNADDSFQWFDAGAGLTNGTTYAAGEINKQAYSYSTIVPGRPCLNGVLRTQFIVITSPYAHTRLSLGSNVGVNLFLNGYIQRFAYYPTCLSDSQLQELTS